MGNTYGSRIINLSMSIRGQVRRIMRLRDESGKFTKSQAYYVDDGIQKPLRCGNCEFYDGENNKCDLVSEEGPPGEGRISRDGTCTLFNARPPRITALQWLWGRADLEGVAPEKVRATAFMITYATLDEEPPTELKEKAVISPEKIKRTVPGL